ncbi:hypothetical protein MASR1M29_13330 [Cloacibacterium normanense]
MKKIFFIVLAFFSLYFNAQQKKTNTSTAKSTSLSYMKNYNDKYPFEVKLIEKKGAFRTRLQKLMGKEKFQDLEDFFNVESPITIKNNVMIAYGCMQHNCDGFYFKIFYDFNKDIINVGIKEGENPIEILGEKGIILDRAAAFKINPYTD